MRAWTELVLGKNAMSLPTPYYDEGGITIYHADCRDILPHLPKVDLVLTDPPYGIDAGNTTFGNADHYQKGDWDKTTRPAEIFESLKKCRLAVVFGGNYYALPPSPCWLVWDKQTAGITTFADAELAWTNFPGAVRLVRHLWSGPYQKHKEARYHPTQKPVGVVSWCIVQADKHEQIETILDPFMGSGTTLLAAKDLGRKAIGIEIEEKYCEIAVRRLAQEVLKYE